MLNIFKKKDERSEGSAQNKKFQITDYYGRFTLDDIDSEIDVIKLNKLHAEVRLDYENNRVSYDETGNIKTKKQINFCRFMLARIEQRISELKKIKDLSRDIIKFKRAAPDKWKLMVAIIVERYPGVDLNHINEIIDSEY